MQEMNGPVLTGRGNRGEFCKANGVFRPICRSGEEAGREASGSIRRSKSLRYSGDTDVRPHSSHRRYTMGSDSHLPITWALGTPQRGHTTAPAGRRLAIGVTSYS